DDIDLGRKGPERRDIVISGHGFIWRHIEGRTMRIGTVDMALEAQFRRRQRQHAAQLPATQDADGGAGGENGGFIGQRHYSRSDGNWGTDWVWRARWASSRSARSSSLRASTEAAKSAALMAPGSPMANVPTGMPPGICTME